MNYIEFLCKDAALLFIVTFILTRSYVPFTLSACFQWAQSFETSVHPLPIENVTISLSLRVWIVWSPFILSVCHQLLAHSVYYVVYAFIALIALHVKHPMRTSCYESFSLSILLFPMNISRSLFRSFSFMFVSSFGNVGFRMLFSFAFFPVVAAWGLLFIVIQVRRYYTSLLFAYK